MTEKIKLSDMQHFKIKRKPDMTNAKLVVSWNEDAGSLGPAVIDYINDKLHAFEFAEIEPTSFFPLGGVLVDGDVSRFPESRFFSCEERNLVTLKSMPPQSEWHKFLSSILDIAELCGISEIYTLGGMVAIGAHSTPRQILAVSNTLDFKDSLAEHELHLGLDYETQPGQKPTPSSYLLWLAKSRGVSGANLWIPVPFYFITIEDYRSWKKALDFLNRRLSLGLDFAEIDEKIKEQNERISEAIARNPDLEASIRKLESNELITQKKSEKLVSELKRQLKRKEGSSR
jgi:proteasome assembly chaperone (PAC2) family protein